MDCLTIYFNDVEKHSLLSPEREFGLFKRLSEGDQSVRDEIILSNLRLVINIVRGYVSDEESFIFREAIQEGNIGLMKATDKFDYTRGNKFSTYASWWIKQSVLRYFEKQHALFYHLYLDKGKRLYRFIRIRDDFFKETGIHPDISQIAEKMNISVEEAKDLSRILKPASLNNKLDKDNSESNRFENLISDPKVDVEETISNKDLHEFFVFKLFPNLLNSHQSKILEARFFEQKTLNEAGERIERTKERARQIKEESLNKIRENYPQIKELLLTKD